MKVDPKKIDWNNLGFEYMETPFRFQAVWENGKWSEGELLEDPIVHIEEGSTSLHYAQECFEGMKAYATPKGVNLFRPEENCKRMGNTAQRVLMPPVPEDLFMAGVEKLVKANIDYVPPYGTGASFYIRPLLIGVGENMGLKSANKFIFRVFGSPVGPYYKTKGLTAVSMLVSDFFDRAAPRGIGAYKAGSNYAGGLHATKTAKDKGYSECIYLDSKENRYLDEAGSANILVVMKDGTLVTPKSASILPSITRKSVMDLAVKKQGRKIEERAIDFLAEVQNFSEVGACGTAAVISPIGLIHHAGKDYSFYDGGKSPGPVLTELYNLLTGIQNGSIPDDFGWTRQIA